MYQPATYAVTLAFMITSMLCWGSWANTVKLCPGYRFQLFYWDYVIGLIVGVVFRGLTLGSIGQTGQSFIVALSQTSASSIEYAILAGVIFNVANLLLVAAIDIAGLAVAFPVGIGVALVVGAVSSYLIAPAGNKLLLFGGIAFVVAAIVFDAAAYRLRDTDKQAMSKRGVIISVISGLLMGSSTRSSPRQWAQQAARDPTRPHFLCARGRCLRGAVQLSAHAQAPRWP